MTITAIIITGLVFAMMFGPLMLMQPSRRQQQLAALRNKALTLGLKVQLQSYQSRTVSVYQKPWPVDDGRKWCSNEWRLEKKAYSHDIHFSGYWDWAEGLKAHKDCCDSIMSLMDEIPEGVDVLSLTKLGINCYWDERGGEVVLNKVEQLLGRLSLSLWPICSRY